jgi:lysozyme family protein
MTETLIQSELRRWKDCKINPTDDHLFTSVAARLSAPEAKARYKTVEEKTGVPWWFTAVVHEREASQKWNTQLGQGDPLNKVSTHVPKGRGPFNTWEEGAIDALTNTAPYAAKNKDWSVGGALAMLEKYNGLGYFNKGLPSPYIWAGTNQYVRGKYVQDGVFDSNFVDKQLGCAGLLDKMGAFKSSTPTVIGTAGTVIVGGGAVAAANAGYNPWIIAGVAAAVIVIGIVGYLIYKRNK